MPAGTKVPFLIHIMSNTNCSVEVSQATLVTTVNNEQDPLLLARYCALQNAVYR